MSQIIVIVPNNSHCPKLLSLSQTIGIVQIYCCCPNLLTLSQSNIVPLSLSLNWLVPSTCPSINLSLNWLVLQLTCPSIILWPDQRLQCFLDFKNSTKFRGLEILQISDDSIVGMMRCREAPWFYFYYVGYYKIVIVKNNCHCP